MIEDVKRNIMTLLDQFKKEEMGNRLSQFSFIALRMAVESELAKLGEKNGSESG